MKVLTVLSAAAVASALPIHANIKLVSVDKEGHKSVQTYENVDLGDSYEEARLVLKGLSSTPYELKPEMNENDQKIEEIAEPDQKIIQEAENLSDEILKEVEEEFKDLQVMGLENLEQLKSHAAEFVEEAKKYVDEAYISASNRYHKIVDSQGNDVPDPAYKKLMKPKNFKGKHNFRKGGKKLDANAEQVLDEESQAAKSSGKSLRKVHHRKPCHDLKIKKLGGKPHSPVHPKMHSSEASAIGSVKQWSQDLYHDVADIDFRQSFNNIAESNGALCAIGAGLICGFLLTMLAVAVKFATRPSLKTIQLSEAEDEESSLVSEKQ